MSNLNAVLNDRMTKVARKCIRQDTGVVRRLVAQHRRDIAALKRQIVGLQKTVAFLERQEKRRMAAEPTPSVESTDIRFRADGLKAHRARLGLSAEDYGRLVGASGLSIYHWEAGKSHPRESSVAKIAALRGIGKREALRRLELLNAKR